MTISSTLLEHPLATAEFLVVDTETNGRAGAACEVTEVGAVLVGGGELHDRWESLLATRAPLSRGIERFTGITQAMVDAAPPAELALPELARQLEGRVLVAHNASFDVRVLRQAFSENGLAWPDPPTVCTVALARRFHPLGRQRKLAPLADSLGIEVETTHRALADAETCARVFCALFGRLNAEVDTVRAALDLLSPARRKRTRARNTDGGVTLQGLRKRAPDCSHLPDEPGVYLFRNAEGQLLYVGKSVSLRRRARSHFMPSAPATAWAMQAETVDYEATASELGALLLEQRHIRRALPPGNVARKHQDPFVYLRCRLDIPFPILEVRPEPAAGHAVSVGPLASRSAAVELMEQLNSLFGLRHCGRRLPRRDHPSAYGQMGRCLSPCLQDLDPNLYRRRLDEALGLFADRRQDGGRRLLAHVDAQMREAIAAQAFERAAWLQRRRERMRVLLERLGGVLEAVHARPRLLLAPHPRDAARGDVLWLAGGRLVDRCELGAGADELAERTAAVLARHGNQGPTAHLAPDDVAEQRVIATWIASHSTPTLDLDAGPSPARIAAFLGTPVEPDTATGSRS